MLDISDEADKHTGTLDPLLSRATAPSLPQHREEYTNCAMAPKKSDATGRPNRVRFVLLEADLSDSNFTELTHAINQALKPQQPLVTKLLAPSAVAATPSAQTPLEDAEVEPALDAEEPGQEENEEAAPRTPRAKAKLPLPKYLHDLNMAGNGKAFKQFAEETAPKSQMKRYLAAAYWLKEHGGSPTINTDKVYTCFKTAGWPVGISDWDANFRSAVKLDTMRRVSPGEYAITPLGESKLAAD